MLLKHNLTVKICYDEGLWWAYVKRGELIAKEGADSPSLAFQKLGNLMRKHGNYYVLDFASKTTKKRLKAKLAQAKGEIEKTLLDEANLSTAKLGVKPERLEIKKGVKQTLMDNRELEVKPGMMIEVNREMVDGKVKFYSKKTGKEIKSYSPDDVQGEITGEAVITKLKRTI